MGRNYYERTTWNIICDSCGKKMKANKAKHRWDGFLVCDSCWEPRQSLDFVKAKKEKIGVPYSRPEITDQFISVSWTTELSCTPITKVAQADFGTADCATVGQSISVMYNSCLAEHQYSQAGIGVAGCAIVGNTI
jgi:hypothetical protein